MAKLTKAQRSIIERSLANAERTYAYMMQPTIAIGRIGGIATTTLHYKRDDGSTFYAQAKDVGSDLVGIQFTIEALRSLLLVDAELGLTVSLLVRSKAHQTFNP